MYLRESVMVCACDCSFMVYEMRMRASASMSLLRAKDTTQLTRCMHILSYQNRS